MDKCDAERIVLTLKGFLTHKKLDFKSLAAIDTATERREERKNKEVERWKKKRIEAQTAKCSSIPAIDVLIGDEEHSEKRKKEQRKKFPCILFKL